MSVSGISSSNFANYQSTSVQNQQQWQQAFQQLGQELQSGNLSPLQTTAQTTESAAQTELTALQSGSANSSTTAAPVGTPASPILFNTPQGSPVHGIHARPPHHLRVDAGDDNDSDGQDSNPLGQAAPSASSASAQQAYSSWQQDLQQVALNSDLLTAQAAAWQPVSLSA
jgi:hypothetical protein